MDLNSLLSRPNALPSAPHAVLRLMKTFEDDDVHIKEIVSCIESDPVIVAKVLRLANSPFFYRGRPAESVLEAVALMGQTKVRALVIGLIAKDSFPSLPEDALKQFWRFSSVTGELARYIAQKVGADDDVAYTGGLLHMIGELVMRVVLTKEMNELDDKIHPLAVGRDKAELAKFGYSFAEVGAELCRKWELPSRMIEVVASQSNPDLENPNHRNATIVHIASWRARALELQIPEEVQIRFFPIEASKAIGLDPSRVANWEPEAPREDAPVSEDA